MKKNNLGKTNPVLLFLVALTLVSVGFGGWKIYHNIYSPFSQPKRVATAILSPEEQMKILTQDSDKDGLTDLEEQSMGTSIYIPDTDSDNFSDREELAAGSNPLDPGSTPQNKVVSQEPVVTERLLGAAVVSPEEIAETTQIEAPKELSASEIREVLVKQGGLSSEVVDKIDDETLIKLYNETRKELGTDLGAEGSQSPDSSQLGDQLLTGSLDKTFFNLLSAAQIRELLIQAGADEKALEGIDDETLKTLFLQALESQK